MNAFLHSVDAARAAAQPQAPQGASAAGGGPPPTMTAANARPSGTPA
jgi:hypothetical protein